MKSYILTLTNLHFTKNGKVWISEAIDLYDNSSYTNYSTLRSRYGLNSFGDYTFVGNSVIPSATPTVERRSARHRHR
jgi:hypothetical protein